MSEYTPTTDEVRECWATAEINPDGYIADGLPVPNEIEQYAEFNRWLDQVKAAARREGRAEAWDACVTKSEARGWMHDYAVTEMQESNPYRKEAGQ